MLGLGKRVGWLRSGMLLLLLFGWSSRLWRGRRGGCRGWVWRLVYHSWLFGFAVLGLVEVEVEVMKVRISGQLQSSLYKDQTGGC